MPTGTAAGQARRAGAPVRSASMDIEVARDALATARMVETTPAEPSVGEVVFGIDSFALTANNVTYGAVGDLVGY